MRHKPSRYFETIGQLLARGFAVAALDWRGQAGSARQLKNPHKGHIDDFSLYERDLNAFVTEVLGPSCPRPWFGLCHSMGAAIMLGIAHLGAIALILWPIDALIGLAFFVFWLIATINAFQGKAYRIPVVSTYADRWVGASAAL